MDFKNKVALITGGVSGIGASIVEEFLRNEIKHAVILDVDVSNGKIFVDKLKKIYGGDKVTFIQTDVTNETNFEDAFKEIITKFTRLDIIVNNAGIVSKNYQLMIDINLTAVIRGTQLAIKYLSKLKGGNGGVVLNISSISGFEKYNVEPAYAASKAGIIVLTRSYGDEFYKEHGITFLTLCPGYTDTNLTLKYDSTQKQKDEIEVHKKIIVEQKAESVGKAAVHVIRIGKNGEVFTVHASKLYLCNISPPLSELVLEGL